MQYTLLNGWLFFLFNKNWHVLCFVGEFSNGYESSDDDYDEDDDDYYGNNLKPSRQGMNVLADVHKYFTCC